MGARQRPTAAPRVAARTLALVVGLVGLVVATVACSGDDDDAGPPTSAPAATTVTGGTGASDGSPVPAPSGPEAARPAGCVFSDPGATELAGLSGRDGALAIPMASPLTVTPGDAEAALPAAVDGGCGFVVAYGGRLEHVVDAVAATAPAVGFVLVDAGTRPSLATDPPPPTPTTAGELAVGNVLVLDVRLDQAAFLAGFLAASASGSHTVAVVAPGDDAGASPATTALAASFRAGVRYRDGLRGASTTVVDAVGPPADIVFGLDGRSVQDLAAKGAKVITPDGDACARTPAVCPLVLSGLVADVGPALRATADLAAAGRFRGGTQPVSVADGAVRLAPVPPQAGVANAAILEVAGANVGIERGEVRVSPRDVPG